MTFLTVADVYRQKAERHAQRAHFYLIEGKLHHALGSIRKMLRLSVTASELAALKPAL